MIRINLLAADRPAKGKGGKKASVASTPGATQAYLILAVFAGGAALLCLAAYLYMSGQIRELDGRIATLEARQRQLQAIKAQVDALEKKRATFQQKVDLIEKLKAEQSGPVHMLDELSKALPDFVWLSSMEQAGNAVKLSGESNGLTSVAEYMTALERTGWFPAVDLVSSTEQQNVIKFVLAANFRNPEVAKKEAEMAARKPIPGSTPARPVAAPAPAGR